jgi:sugar/nucleoside kinase (ribokinase family)
MVAGDLFLDIVMSGFAYWPEPGEESVASEICREVGGGAAITACGLAKLGSKVGVLGVVGSDVGSWMIDRLRKCGVETSGIHYDLNEATAFTVAISSPRDRSFFTYPGANNAFPRILMDAATERMLSHARHVHLACAPELDSILELLQALRENDCCISLDVGWHEAWLRDARAMEAVRHVDIFFPNQKEAFAMTGEDDAHRILEHFRGEGVKAVVLKLGNRGAGMLWQDRICFVARYHVDAVDTTGAGDCFNAGFLHAWLRSQDAETCLRAAAICGALSTEALGGISGFPSRDRLEVELKKAACAESR